VAGLFLIPKSPICNRKSAITKILVFIAGFMIYCHLKAGMPFDWFDGQTTGRYACSGQAIVRKGYTFDWHRKPHLKKNLGGEQR
jgi:hypothetical protein